MSNSSQRIILRIESTPSQSLPDVERGERSRMECAYEVNREDTPEEAGRKAGERIAQMLRQTSHHNED